MYYLGPTLLRPTNSKIVLSVSVMRKSNKSHSMIMNYMYTHNNNYDISFINTYN